MRLFTLLSSLAGALLALSAPAFGQVAPDENATGRAIVLSPLTLLKIEDMDFGSLTVTAAGTAILDPVNGTVTTTGGVLSAGGDPLPALFAGAASRNTPVKIRIPNKPITITRVGGTETMTVSGWTLNGPADRRVGMSRAFDFRVGATLNVTANQADGLYTGEFMVEVQYP